MSFRESDFLYAVGVKGVDPTIPIHLLPIEQFRTFRVAPIYDRFAEKYKSHKYLRYIGKDLQIQMLRDAEEFEIIYFEKDLKTIRYAEIYNKERITFMRTYFNYYNFITQASYEASRIMELKLNALINYRIDSVMNIYDRTQYTEDETIRTWSKYNLTVPPFMPTIQRDAVTYLLNYLTINKGTIDVLQYITDNVFNSMKLHKYFMTKKFKPGLPEDTTGMTPTELYDIEFIKTDYKAKTPYDEATPSVISYDTIVKNDKKWFDTEEVRDFVHARDFNYLTSKYISIENMIDITTLSTRMSVLTRIIINNKVLLSHLKIYYDETKQEETLFDLFTYVQVLISTKYNFNDIIPDSLESIFFVCGFQTPSDLEELAMWFHAFFEGHHKYGCFLHDFPTIVTDETFYTFLRKLERSIDIVRMLQEMVMTNRFVSDDYLLYRVENAIMMCMTVPEAYHLAKSEEGSTYTDYLRLHSPKLYSRFIELVARFDASEIANELDYILRVIKNKFLEYVEEDSEAIKALGDITSMYSGMVEYLSKILMIFKGFSSDLLSSETVLQIGASVDGDSGREWGKGIDEVYMNFYYPIQTEKFYSGTFDMLYDPARYGYLNKYQSNARMMYDRAQAVDYVISQGDTGSYAISEKYNDVYKEPKEEIYGR